LFVEHNFVGRSIERIAETRRYIRKKNLNGISHVEVEKKSEGSYKSLLTPGPHHSSRKGDLGLPEKRGPESQGKKTRTPTGRI